MTAPPNTILIHVDQHRFDCTGLGGHPQAHTPNLDRMGEEGVVFRRAFTPIPLCCPARQTLLCGQWPIAHQNLVNYDIAEMRNALTPETPTYSALLRDAGYALHYLGKWHVSNLHDPTAFGFDSHIALEDYPHWEERAKPESQFTPFAAVDPLPAEQTLKHWLTDRALSILRKHAGGDRPFHIRLDFHEPHLPNIVPEPFASMIDPDAIEPWGSFEERFEHKPWIQRQLLRHWGIADWSWDRWRRLVALYLADIAHIDYQVGRVLKEVESLGLDERTMIVYTSDHGDMTGSHRLFDKHHVLYDDVVHIPLYIRWKGHIETPGVREQWVLNELDLPSTLLGAAGIDPPKTMQGQNLLPILRDPEFNNGRRDVCASLHGSQFGLYSQRMIRDEDYKYILNATDVDELYDLRGDPWELRNLAVDPKHEPILRAYRERLVAWGVSLDDPLFVNPFMANSLLTGRKCPGNH